MWKSMCPLYGPSNGISPTFSQLIKQNVGRLLEIRTLCCCAAHNILPEKEDLMSYMSKPFEELDILVNFLMNAIATDQEIGEAFWVQLHDVHL